MKDRTKREQEIADELGVSRFHPMIIEAVEIERGERNRDGSWKVGPTIDHNLDS